MIRSSRIPPLLNKVCSDGILSCYLITSDGELLGRSDAHLSLDPYKNSDQSSTPASPSPWGIMDPNDVSALVAEVVEDYKRLGFELALLNTSYQQGVSSSNTGGASTLEPSSGALSHQSSGSEKHAKDKDRGRLNCLIVEMEKVSTIARRS